MREFATTYLKLFRLAVVLAGIQVCFTGVAMAKIGIVKKIYIRDNPLSVEFDVTGKAPVKVIRISKTEVLVAIKNVSLAKGFTIQGKNHPSIASVNVEALEGNVVAVVVVGKNAYGKLGSRFNKTNTRLMVSLGEKKTAASEKPAPAAKETPSKTSQEKPDVKVMPKAKEPIVPVSAPPKKSDPPAANLPSQPKPLPKNAAPVKKDEKNKRLTKEAEKVKMATAPVYVPPKRSKSEFKGDISDLYRGPDPMACEAKQVQNALLLIKKELYKEAYEVLDQYMFKENFSCLEQVYFLKAYVYYKGVEEGDFTRLIKAERMFQDAVVSYPKSQYLPFAYTAMGMIQAALKNMSAAEGYFNIVHQEYKEYTGMPEVQYHLARIYDEKGYTDKALRLYKRVFQSPLDNSYITDAGVGYGKALFNKRQYFDALSIFNYVIKNDVKKVYEGPDLLLYTADANFELGLSKGARENYIRVMNLFPDIPNKDLVLSKVGDAYGLENNEEKAKKIYELVREKFPETPGFINASIGLARYLETDEEKIEIYEMIKIRFPDNTYARIAMMRLAEIYQKNGEYNKCIQEIEDLLSTHPRGLRYEAVKLMQRAYEALFKQQLKADEYTKVLNRYELEHVKIDKMSSRLIDFQVGMAYLEAGLYEQSFNHLIKAYKQYKRSQRRPELLYGLGRAMDESGRDADALKLYQAFSRRFPKSRHRVTALLKTGKIYLEKKQYSKAASVLKKAHSVAKNSFERGSILMLHAEVNEKKGSLKQAALFRERAVKAYSAAPGQNYEVLAASYKRLGNTFLDLHSFVRAADAFAKALSFSEGDRAKANIGFLLGDAYQKGNILDKAKEAFEQVAQSYDSVWARLAQQRLSTLDLAETMINS